VTIAQQGVRVCCNRQIARRSTIISRRERRKIQTCSMAENSVTIFQRRWRWGPSVTQTSLEQFICIWYMIPHGDRSYRSQSGCVVNEHKAIAPGNYYIMSKLVLFDVSGNDLRQKHTWPLRAAPIDYIEKPVMHWQLIFNCNELFRR